MDRHRKQLEVVIKPETKLRAALPSDVQKVIVGEEHQQEWSSSLDQEDPEPPHIKEEQEELWTSQEGEQLQGLEEADIKIPFTPVPVKSEDDEEKEYSVLRHRQTEQIKIEADGEDCGGPEPARISDPDTHLQPDTDDKTGDSPEPETDDSDDWKETREPQSGLNSLNSDEVCVSNLKCSAAEKSFICSECGKRFGHKGSLKRHMRTHTGEKPFSCSVCKKYFTESGHLQNHMRSHTGEKPFGCSECGKRFAISGYLKKHVIIHTGEKPLSCEVCGKRFIESRDLKRHMRTHTGEKPFSCSECEKRFGCKGGLKMHMRTHTGEKPFSCSVCNKSFTQSTDLQRHISIHTGHKPFSCSVCGKAFFDSRQIKIHMRTHTGEKRYSCSVCDQRFTWYNQLKRHNCVGRESSQLHHTQNEENREAERPATSATEPMKTETDGEDCGGPEPARTSDPNRHLQPETDDKTGLSSVIVGKEQQQEWSSSLNQEETEPPHIKEEQDDLLIGHEGAQLQGLEEAQDTRFPFTLVPVKSEDEENLAA